MNIIVAADTNWAIGNKNELLVSIPNDHKHFRQETTGKVVVFGRKTLVTFPGGLPLQGRINIILSTDLNFKVKGATVVHSIKELLEILRNYKSEDIFIIGGESVYRQMLPYCDTAHVTKINHAYDADTYFPNLDELPDWKITADSEEQTYFDLEYVFVKYQKMINIQVCFFDIRLDFNVEKDNNVTYRKKIKRLRSRHLILPDKLTRKRSFRV